MHIQAWRSLVVTGLFAGTLAAAAGCSSEDDPNGTGNQSGSGATTAGTGTSGSGGGGQGGGSGSGSGGAGTSGAAGSSAGTGGVAGVGGSAAGTAGGGAAGSGAAGGSGGAGASGGTGGTPAAGSGGDTGGAGANAGSGGDGGSGGMVTLVTPIMRSATSYVLEFGDVFFEVNPMLGARVVDVHLKGGTNLFGGMGDNSGSVFWPAPQTWEWEPTREDSITNINDKPYTASTDDTSMSFVGMPAPAVNLSVTKRYAADLAKEAIVITYGMTASAAGVMAAPWEVTRFPQKGVTFYPTGSTPVAGNGMELPPTTTGAGCTWLTAPASLPANHQKLLADGTGGWLAHAEDDWVIVKKFADLPANMAAPNEAEIEIYLSSQSDYMEVEQQGAYGPVSTSEAVEWTVTWFVRRLPSGVTATAGNQALVDFVNGLVQ